MPSNSARPNTAETPIFVGPDWFAEAACKDKPIDPDEFFPVHGRVGDNSRPRLVCARCPIQLQCRRYAWENGERWGIWGGMTTEERYRWALSEGLPRYSPRPWAEPDTPWTAKTGLAPQTQRSN